MGEDKSKAFPYGIAETRPYLLSLSPFGDAGSSGEACLCCRAQPTRRQTEQRDVGGRCRSGVIHLRPARRTGNPTKRGRRTAPFRLERMQFGFVSLRSTPAHRTPLFGGARPPLFANLYPGYQTRSAESVDCQNHRARGALCAHRVFAPSHRALRTGGHLCQRFGRSGRRRASRHFSAGSLQFRRAGEMGNGPRAAIFRATISGGISLRTPC